MNLTIGHLSDWKSKIYVTTVLDSFQDRKGITLKVVNNKQVIRLYSMEHGRNKTTERTRETRPLPSCVCLSRTVPFLSPCDFHVPVTEATKMSLFCSSFRTLPWHRFFCSFWLSFTGVVLVSGNESKVSSTGCTKNQWLQCSCRLMGSLQKYFYSRCYKHDFCYFCVRITFFINTN